MIKHAYESYSDYKDNQLERASKSQRKTRKRIPDFEKNAQMFKSKYPELKSILCIGARDKSEVQVFKDFGYEAVGIDLIEAEGLIMCDMSAIYLHPFFKDKKFDIVYMSHSLEHCFDFEGLQMSIAHLEPKIVYVEVPCRADTSPWDCCIHDVMLDPTIENCNKLFSGYKADSIDLSKKMRKHRIVKFILQK